jgi:transketolase
MLGGFMSENTLSVTGKWDSNLPKLADRLRRWSVEMTHKAGASHVGTSLSMVELLTVLYGKVLRIDPQQPEWPDRDRFILSKGHGCAVYYAVLAEMGFFPLDWLDTFYQDGSRLAGHATHTHVPGIEISTGSLGHGLSVATGMALSAKRDQKPWRTFCLLSDGECDEGSTWEPIMFASQHKLDNLVAIVDYNKIQSLGTVKEVMDLEPFADKWRAFGWAVREIDGHNLDEVQAALEHLPYESGTPTCIIAHTVKGKGISFMEDKLLWHYRSPQGEEFRAAIAELENDR